MAYVHCVYFTCKPETTADTKDAQIEDAKALLAEIPTVTHIESGLRDASIARDVSVTDFDIGLMVTFEDRAGLDTYSDHPLHLKYVSKYRDNWSQIRVFDFISG